MPLAFHYVLGYSSWSWRVRGKCPSWSFHAFSFCDHLLLFSVRAFITMFYTRVLFPKRNSSVAKCTCSPETPAIIRVHVITRSGIYSILRRRKLMGSRGVRIGHTRTPEKRTPISRKVEHPVGVVLSAGIGINKYDGRTSKERFLPSSLTCDEWLIRTTWSWWRRFTVRFRRVSPEWVGGNAVEVEEASKFASALSFVRQISLYSLLDEVTQEVFSRWSLR